MTLPLQPPVLPQLARPRAQVPADAGWAHEPKWDGFRALAFVDGEEVFLQSRNGKPLRRYFPELTFMHGRYVLDGEIVILGPGGRQEFDLLGQRVHPAPSRIARLAEETPARFVAFDLLAQGDQTLLERPFAERRAALEALVTESVDLTPSTRIAAEAEPWLRAAEGVISKLLDAPYRPGERTGMVKVKRVRTIDAVVRGWRPGKEPGTLGSLVLGLHAADGELSVVGHTSGFTAKQKRELPARLAPYDTGERGHGEPSRWSNARDLEWVMLRPELVVEVSFDHVSDGRIRHGAKLLRWREDKPAADCLLKQLDS